MLAESKHLYHSHHNCVYYNRQHIQSEQAINTKHIKQTEANLFVCMNMSSNNCNNHNSAPGAPLKPRGLVNLGNTCYFNSIMQVLLNAPFFGHLLEGRTSSSDNKYELQEPNDGQPIELELPECDFAVRALVDLYKAFISSNSQSLAPSKLMSCIRQKTGRFQRLVQEDSHELLRSLIDIIRSDEIRRQKAAIISYLGDSKSDPQLKSDCFTIVDFVFGGYFLSSVQCQKCRFKSQHLEPFYDLSLAITDPIQDIHSAISNFTSNAILDGENKFICERCSKVHGVKTYEAGVKSTKIASPPNILTLHLKRFEANSLNSGSGSATSRGLGGGRRGKRNQTNGRNNKGRNKKGSSSDNNDGDTCEDDWFSCGGRSGTNFRKINKHIEFSEFLDISEFTCELCYDLTKINRWPRINQGDSIWYSLFGVVCHSGNLRGGHYTAYVKCEEPNSDTFDMVEFAHFIQAKPYVPGLAIDQIYDSIRRHDESHCETTDRYRDDDSNGIDKHLSSEYNEKPRSIPGSWYHISDSDVRKSSLAQVLSSQAYILFYRRVIE